MEVFPWIIKKEGLPYRYDDPELLGDQHIYQNKMIEYNLTLPTEIEKRQKLLQEVFAEIGEKDRMYYYKNRKLDVWE